MRSPLLGIDQSGAVATRQTSEMVLPFSGGRLALDLQHHAQCLEPMACVCQLQMGEQLLPLLICSAGACPDFTCRSSRAHDTVALLEQLIYSCPASLHQAAVIALVKVMCLNREREGMRNEREVQHTSFSISACKSLTFCVKAPASISAFDRFSSAVAAASFATATAAFASVAEELSSFTRSCIPGGALCRRADVPLAAVRNARINYGN